MNVVLVYSAPSAGDFIAASNACWRQKKMAGWEQAGDVTVFSGRDRRWSSGLSVLREQSCEDYSIR